MLYAWSGAAYRSKQIDLAEINVSKSSPIKITHLEAGNMMYCCADLREMLCKTEGFNSRAEMDNWFRPLVKIGETITKHIMFFEIKNNDRN